MDPSDPSVKPAPGEEDGRRGARRLSFRSEPDLSPEDLEPVPGVLASDTGPGAELDQISAFRPAVAGMSAPPSEEPVSLPHRSRLPRWRMLLPAGGGVLLALWLAVRLAEQMHPRSEAGTVTASERTLTAGTAGWLVRFDPVTGARLRPGTVIAVLRPEIDRGSIEAETARLGAAQAEAGLLASRLETLRRDLHDFESQPQRFRSLLRARLDRAEKAGGVEGLKAARLLAAWERDGREPVRREELLAELAAEVAVQAAALASRELLLAQQRGRLDRLLAGPDGAGMADGQELRSPCAGTMVRRLAQAGSRLAAGSGVAVLAEDGSALVWARFPPGREPASGSRCLVDLGPVRGRAGATVLSPGEGAEGPRLGDPGHLVAGAVRLALDDPAVADGIPGREVRVIALGGGGLLRSLLRPLALWSWR